MIVHYINTSNYSAALDVLSKQKDPLLYYRFGYRYINSTIEFKQQICTDADAICAG